MEGFYCCAAALERAVDAALQFYGLEADPADANRRPPPADTFAGQSRRVALGSEVLARVRLSVPVSEDDRRLIYRLVDGACARLEESERDPEPTTCAGATEEALAAYAAAGGGAVGSFARFCERRGFTLVAAPPEDQDLEVPVGPVIARQDARPSPTTTNPRPRATPPGTAAPATTNPTRAIRSSRWSASRKGVDR